MVDGAMMENKVGYGLAVINGAGINTTDDNDKKDIVARIWAKPFLGSEGSPLAGLMVAGATQFGETPMMGEVVDPITGAITEVDLGDENRTRWIGTAALGISRHSGYRVNICIRNLRIRMLHQTVTML